MNALDVLKEDHDYVKKSYPKLRRARLNLGALGKKLMQRKARLAARSG